MRTDRDYLLIAARLALRGHGRAEPNPMVGCVIVAPCGEVVGWGYHEHCGGPHAELHALRRAGAAACGATAYITLEPCNHTGRTGPCSRALIEAKISRVVVARRDPHPVATGGLEALRAAGIEAVVTEICPEASAVSDPFVYRVQSGLPWVTVKWAQTLDGKIATRTGESRWISSESSRRLVHRERGRVDVILTAIGTVLRDDPMLTARGVRVRRLARRVIVDPRLEIPLESKIVRTARDFPTTVLHSEATDAQIGARAEALLEAGLELISVPSHGSDLSLDAAMRILAARHEVTNVLVEAGPGLLGRLFDDGLVCEAWVFIAGMILGDDSAPGPLQGRSAGRLLDAVRLSKASQRSRGGDLVVRYSVGHGAAGLEGSVADSLAS